MVQLMSGLGYRFTTVISAVLWSLGLLLPLVTCVTKVTKHEFEIDYIQKDISWLHCPEGWQKIGTTCILINIEHASFSEATTICRSHGGHLVKIQGFNPNQGFGELVENFILKLNQELTSINGFQYGGQGFWIGLKRNDYGNYSWSDGEVAQVYEGFWSLGQPSGFQQGFEQCCYMNVNINNEYGRYRWSLGSCETRLPFLCEVSACVAGQFRCADGKKCISPTWLCDGVKDCLDESDELDCLEKCGGYLTGTQGSFHSPNYPHLYPHYSFCHWKIEVPAGKIIKLEFQFFSLEDKYDTISVYDGSSSSDPLIATYTGDSTSQIPLSKSNYLVIIFSSDHDGAKQGFNITWHAVTHKSCGGNLVADKDLRFFTSPEYPQKYADNLLCDWIISNPEPGKVVSLQFETFSLEDENDWVEIRDGELESSPLFGRYTGAAMATVFVSSGNKLFVRLKTDNIHRGSGFNASYQSGCDVTVNRGYATIFSPGYGLSDYPSNIKCSWAVTQSENKELALVFRNFDTEENFDNVVVYDDVQKDSASILGEFSGKNVPSPVRSKEMLVEFSSDNQVQRSGWKAVISYDCPSLYPLPNHSSMSTAVTQYNTVVQYSCDIGYHINGPNSIICDIGGKWNTSAPTCNIINCGSPLVPKNGGLLSLNSTLFGGVAVYRCNLGYTLLGNHKVSCTENGWTDYPSCEAVSCPKIVPPTYGNIIKSPNHNNYGAVVEYSCYPHYRSDGQSVAYCSQDGEWSNPPPVCLPPVCPGLFISNGYTNVSDLVEAGDFVRVTCNHGYQVKGSDVIFCNMTGSYDQEIPVCQDMNECDLKDSCNGHLCQNLPGTYYCKCKDGYQHLHGNTTSCVSINECSEDNGGCTQKCKEQDGGYECYCDPGHHLFRGDNSVLIAGQIIVPNKTCIITCPRLNIDNGGSSVSNTTMLHDGSFIYPTSISIICPKGHLPNGPENIVCLQNGTWSSVVTSCEAQSCPPLFADHSDILYSDRNRSADSVATYRCKEGYGLIGNKYRHCILSRNTVQGNRMYAWTGSDPKCQAVDCGSLPDPSFGKVLYNTTTYESQAEYRCQCGYQLTGSKVRVCQQNGLWSGTNVVCSLATCSHPGNPAFGSVKKSFAPHFIGRTIEFQCDRKGYHLTDASPLRCDITKSPSLQFMLEMNYLANTNVSNSCVSYYGYLAIENLKQTLNQPNVTARCSQHSMLQMVEASNYIGSAKGKTVTLNVAMTIGSTTSSVESTCLCGRNIIATLNSDQKWLTDLLQIPGNSSFSCPVVQLHPKEISEQGRKWLCPDTYGLIGTQEATCSEENVPICVRKTTDDCLLESPVPMTTESPLLSSTVSEDSPISVSFTRPVTTTLSITDITSAGVTETESTTSVVSSITAEVTSSTIETSTDDLTMSSDKSTTKSAAETSTQMTQTTTGNDTAETTVITSDTTTRSVPELTSQSTTSVSTQTSLTEPTTSEAESTTHRTTKISNTTVQPTSMLTDSTTTAPETTESTISTTTAPTITSSTTEIFTTPRSDTADLTTESSVSSTTEQNITSTTGTVTTTTTEPKTFTLTTESPVTSTTTEQNITLTTGAVTNTTTEPKTSTLTTESPITSTTTEQNITLTTGAVTNTTTEPKTSTLTTESPITSTTTEQNITLTTGAVTNTTTEPKTSTLTTESPITSTTTEQNITLTTGAVANTTTESTKSATTTAITSEPSETNFTTESTISTTVLSTITLTTKSTTIPSTNGSTITTSATEPTVISSTEPTLTYSSTESPHTTVTIVSPNVTTERQPETVTAATTTTTESLTTTKVESTESSSTEKPKTKTTVSVTTEADTTSSSPTTTTIPVVEDQSTVTLTTASVSTTTEHSSVSMTPTTRVSSTTDQSTVTIAPTTSVTTTTDRSTTTTVASVSSTTDQSTTTTVTSVPTTPDKISISTVAPTSVTPGQTLPPQTDPSYHIQYSGEITGDTSQSSCVNDIVSIINTGIENMKGSVGIQLSKIKSCKSLTSIIVSGGTDGFNSLNVVSFTVSFILPKTPSVNEESCGNSLKSYIDGKIINVFEAEIRGSTTCSGLRLNHINFIQLAWKCQQGYELDSVNDVCHLKIADTTTESAVTTVTTEATTTMTTTDIVTKESVTKTTSSTTTTAPETTTTTPETTTTTPETTTTTPETTTTTPETTTTTPETTTTTPETTTTTPEATTTKTPETTTTTPETTTTTPETTTATPETTTTIPETTTTIFRTTATPVTITTKMPITSTTTSLEIPFYLLKIKIVFDGDDLRNDDCRINLRNEITSVMQKTANDVNNKIRTWSICNTTKDIAVLPREAFLAIKLKLNLTVPFAIQSKTFGLSTAVENCAQNSVKQYLNSKLQSDLSDIPNIVRSVNCSDVSLSAFQFTSGWECPDGYELEAQDGVCSLTPSTSTVSTTELPSISTTTMSTTELPSTTETTTVTTTITPIVISTLPPGVRISYKPSFLTDFEVTFLTNDMSNECLSDYKNVLMSLLKQQTGLINMNSNLTNNCQNIYIDLANDVSLNLSHRQSNVIVELYPTDVSIVRQNLQTCNSFVGAHIISAPERLFGKMIITPSGTSCKDQLTVQSVNFSNVTTLCPQGSSLLQTDSYFLCIADNSTSYEFVGTIEFEYKRPCVNQRYVIHMMRDKTDFFISNVAKNISQNRQCTPDIVITQNTIIRQRSAYEYMAQLKFELRSLQDNITNLDPCARSFMLLAKNNLGITLKNEVPLLCQTNKITDLIFQEPQYMCPSNLSWNETEMRCEVMVGTQEISTDISSTDVLATGVTSSLAMTTESDREGEITTEEFTSNDYNNGSSTQTENYVPDHTKSSHVTSTFSYTTSDIEDTNAISVSLSSETLDKASTGYTTPTMTHITQTTTVIDKKETTAISTSESTESLNITTIETTAISISGATASSDITTADISEHTSTETTTITSSEPKTNTDVATETTSTETSAPSMSETTGTTTETTTRSPVVTTETTVSSPVVTTESTASSPVVTTETTASSPVVTTETTASSPVVTTETSASSMSETTGTTTETTASSPVVTTETMASSLVVTTETTASSPVVTTETTASSPVVTTETSASSMSETTGTTTETTASSPVVTTETTTSSPVVTTETTASSPVVTTETTASSPVVSTESTASSPVVTTETTASSPVVTTETTSSPVVTTETTTSSPVVSTETTTSSPVVTTETTASSLRITTETVSSLSTSTGTTSSSPKITVGMTVSSPSSSTEATTNSQDTSTTNSSSTTEFINSYSSMRETTTIYSNKTETVTGFPNTIESTTDFPNSVPEITTSSSSTVSETTTSSPSSSTESTTSSSSTVSETTTSSPSSSTESTTSSSSTVSETTTSSPSSSTESTTSSSSTVSETTTSSPSSSTESTTSSSSTVSETTTSSPSSSTESTTSSSSTVSETTTSSSSISTEITSFPTTFTETTTSSPSSSTESTTSSSSTVSETTTSSPSSSTESTTSSSSTVSETTTSSPSSSTESTTSSSSTVSETTTSSPSSSTEITSSPTTFTETTTSSPSSSTDLTTSSPSSSTETTTSSPSFSAETTTSSPSSSTETTSSSPITSARTSTNERDTTTYLLSTTTQSTSGITETTTLSQPSSFNCAVCSESKTVSVCKSQGSTMCTQGSCQTVVRYIKKSPRIAKSCAATSDCLNLASPCDPTEYSTTCVYCCQSDMCNDETTFITFQGKRRKRATAAGSLSTSTGQVSPSWNASIPQCTDMEAPVFINCSSDPVYINVGHGGVLPVEIPLPVAIDNSGLPSLYTFLPEDFRLPYLFRNNGTNVTVIATDATGNQNNCTILVLFRDVNPPVITCPVTVVVEQYNVTIDTDNVRPKFENTGVQSPDNIQYKLDKGSDLSLIRLGDHVNVTATAYDESGNNATCYFTYEAQKVTYPNYNFSFTFSVKNVECDKNWHNKIWSKFGDLLQRGCRQVYADTYNILESEVRVHHNKTRELVEVKAWIGVRKLNQSPSAIKDCADKAIEEVKKLKGDNSEINCTNVEVNFMGVTSENFTCDEEGLLQEDKTLCLYCTRGSYPDPISNQCRPCPSPEGSDLVPHNSCQICTGDTTTDKFKCLDECQAGEYSPTGYQPCKKCATGTYSDHTKAEICIACLPGKTTLKSGSTSSHDCKEICPAGYFGYLGLSECEVCPKNFYSSRNGTTQCSECRAGNVTLKTKSTSPDDCIFVDHCARYGCENGGICTNTDQGRYYKCTCLPGFIGEHCETTVDGCLSNPCVNGGRCSKNDNDYTCKCDSGYTGKNCETLIDNCVNDPCNNGYCINDHFSFDCVCHTGFTGERCDKNIDDCSPNPCNNGGSCIDLINDYTCNCTGTGHHGRHCSIRIEDCYNESCLNGGACHDRNDGFECSCSHGFTGQHCEINIDDCVSDFCKNGGVCIDGINSYSCLCQPGFSGDHCQVDIDNCKTNPCKNHGICENRKNDFYCHCHPGYEGKLCEVNHDDCSSSPCNMETTLTCVDGVDNFTCKCLPGWMGVHCEIPIIECESSPCQHGGTCFDDNHGYSCKCKEGYKGHDCNIDVNECERFPCYNGRQCKNNDGNFTCICLPGFEGRLCQQHINQCQSSPCKNGGSCIDVIENFTCLCPSGWTGQLCDKNINECKSQPCLNGATCHDGVNDFNCTCLPGYEGKACDKEIDECLSNPCKNGGTCVDELGQYRCQCVQGFTGRECQLSEIDECAINGGCKNEGICVQGQCQCPPLYKGPDCGKEKPADFDLFFHGVDGSRCQTPITNVKDTSQFSICLWVRFAVAGSIGTVLTVLEDSGRTADEELREMLHITEDRLLISYFDNLQNFDIELSINDGHWHHVCYTWVSQNGHWSLYLDGIVIMESKGYGQGQQMPGRQRILLGQAAANIDGLRQFHGEVSQLNVYNKALEPSLIKSMATNCSSDRQAGDRHQWAEFSSYIEHGIDVVTPTICGSSKCSPGFRGSLCNIPIDKEPPVVTFCPKDIRIISKDRLNIINWTEPSFGDNNGVEDIVKTHRPGQVFAYGEYNVNYVAFDAENNTASCTFKIFVLPYNCSDPPVSKNTIKACGTWSHGYYCKISCIDPDRYAFTENVPQVYRCGKEGFWDPPRGQIFTFPSCAAVSTASVTIQGQLQLKGPVCTNATKDNLTHQFVKVMKDLDSTLDLCPTEDCDYSKVKIECGAGTGPLVPVRRKKRAVNDDVYKIVFDIPINGSRANVGDESTLQFQTMVKSGDLDTGDFIVDQNSVVIETEATCEEGQVLEANNKCVNCPVGTYHDNETRSCQLCPIGQFSNLEKQTYCQQCPYGNTTETPGATDITDCYDICIAGSYYEEVTRRCELCPKGYYQSEGGMKTCQYCSNGQTTLVEGATSVSQCEDGCKVGTELTTSGNCKSCMKGTYKDSISLASCLTCPYGYTTESYGSISVDQCSIIECEPGHKRDTKDDTCKLCPRGTYQPFREQDFCFICGKGQTTKYPGSSLQSFCYEGPVNECEIEHNCHINASCIDIEDGYNCSCKDGYRGNGTFCTLDKCKNFCQNGDCNYDNYGEPICKCHEGFGGRKCDTSNVPLPYGIIGGVCAGGVTVMVAIVLLVFCHRKRKKMTDEDYQTLPRIHRHQDTVAYPVTPVTIFNSTLNPTFLSDSDISEPTFPIRQMSQGSLGVWSRSDFAASESSSEGNWRDPSPEQSPTLGHPRVRIRTSDPLGENFQVEDSYF